jgi:hypothetical protein
MNEHEKINYIELPSANLEKTRAFFEHAFSWHFELYGPDYMAFADQGVDGGFYRADLCSRSDAGCALVVFYSSDLEATLQRIEASGGAVVKPIFAFPGGRRFHFTEPGGNEFAVWSDLQPTEK